MPAQVVDNPVMATAVVYGCLQGTPAAWRKSPHAEMLASALQGYISARSALTGRQREMSWQL